MAQLYTLFDTLGCKRMANKRTKNALPVPGEVILFCDFVRERYLPFIRENKRSWKTDERYLARHVLPYLGKMPLTEVSEASLRAWLSTLELAGLSSSTRYRLFWLVKYILNCAVRWGCLESDAAFCDARCPRHNGRRPEALTNEEKRKLLSLLSQYSSNASARAIYLLFLTGASKSEILYARWEDVNLRQGMLVTRRTPSGENCCIPLSDEAVRLIKTFPRRADVPWLFFHQGSGKRVVSLFSFWDKLRNELGRPDLHLNDLRHVFVKTLMQNGASYKDVCSRLGHYSAEAYYLQSQTQSDQFDSANGGTRESTSIQ